MKRGTSWILMAVVLAGWAARASAEPDAAVVAVLPLAAADAPMRIYGPPVASTLAERLGNQRGLRVEALSLSGVLPAQVDLVIDGRIVTAPSGEVLLEARVRDPARGITMAAVATGARPLAEIDRLTAELATALAPRLHAAAAARRAAAARQRNAHQPGAQNSDATGTGGTNTADQDAAGETRSRPQDAQGKLPAGHARAPRPALLVFGAVGQAAGGTIPVEPDATLASQRLASRLGRRPVAAAARGIVSPADATQALRKTGATHALMLQVQDVEFAWSGVLMARGRVRAILVDASGRAIYDRTHRTGTLVGNRGDRHAALVRLVMDQVTDVFAPEMRRVLPAPTRVPAHARPGAPGSP